MIWKDVIYMKQAYERRRFVFLGYFWYSKTRLELQRLFRRTLKKEERTTEFSFLGELFFFFGVFQVFYLVLPDSPTTELKLVCRSADLLSWNTEQPFSHGYWSPINSSVKKREQEIKRWRLLAPLEQETHFSYFIMDWSYWRSSGVACPLDVRNWTLTDVQNVAGGS